MRCRHVPGGGTGGGGKEARGTRSLHDASPPPPPQLLMSEPPQASLGEEEARTASSGGLGFRLQVLLLVGSGMVVPTGTQHGALFNRLSSASGDAPLLPASDILPDFAWLPRPMARALSIAVSNPMLQVCGAALQGAVHAKCERPPPSSPGRRIQPCGRGGRDRPRPRRGSWWRASPGRWWRDTLGRGLVSRPHRIRGRERCRRCKPVDRCRRSRSCQS